MYRGPGHRRPGVHDDRSSDGMFFQRGESALVTRIEARIARLLRWPVEHGEGMQVLHYRPSAEYKPHHGYFEPHALGTLTLHEGAPLLEGDKWVTTKWLRERPYV